MASEKAEMSQETESLPPQYARSESAFSDSPPPVYRKTNTVRLQITRLVCGTVLLCGFLTGVFILSHTWISARQCDCGQTVSELPSSARLVQAGVLPPPPARPDAEPLLQESRQLDLPLQEEDVREDLAIAEKVLEEETEELQNLDGPQEEDKRVKLPIGMLLGNPALTGKDVQCKVEKKVHNLGNGILSKTIMVTCDDDSDDEETKPEFDIQSSPFGGPAGRPMPRPPMSLIAPILKMMASRANARLQRQMNQPKIVLRRFPPSMGPFPQGFKGPIRFGSAQSGQNLQSFNAPPSSPSIFRGPTFNPFRPPMTSFDSVPPQNEEPRPMPFDNQPQQEEEFPPRNVLFREDFDREEQPEPLLFRRFPFPQAQDQSRDVEELMTEEEAPVKVMRGFPPQIPDVIKQIVSKIVNDGEGLGNSDQAPVISIKTIPQMGSFDDSPSENRMMLPFPFPAIRLQGRGARKLNLDEDFTAQPAFPLPRGAAVQPVVVPEAGGRALDSPVTIPAPQETSPLRFFPGRLVRVPMPLQGRAITHMEMQQNPINEIPIETEDYEAEADIEEEQPIIEEATNYEDTDPTDNNFGPPRDHSVIESQALLGSPDEMPSFLSHMPSAPPPKFAREGRSGLVEEINPDAEMLAPEHHKISVTK